MVRKVAKEFLHIRDWLGRAGDIVDQGRERYLDDPLLQEAGDSLMMKRFVANRARRLLHGRRDHSEPGRLAHADLLG